MIRTLIVDDEPIAISVLQNHLEHLNDVDVVATASSALDALEIVREGDIDLVFLDIEMPGLSGMDFVDTLSDPPEVIFATAHRDYAVEGFEVDAVDFLVKPIRLPRLIKAIEKYRRRTGTSSDLDTARLPERGPTLNIRVDRQTVRVDISAIRFVESLSDYVTVRTIDDSHITKMTMSDVEDALTPHGFARVHRSYVVNLRRVDAFTPRELEVGNKTIPVSRTYRTDVMERLESSDRR
ncbi:LytR/AlgR family response regulator transcription factor [Longibacter salinarum]|nr:LytTR family DNA-binding domain-containing protein [Longibacter salinarum]